jgi:hypothetical protein
MNITTHSLSPHLQAEKACPCYQIQIEGTELLALLVKLLLVCGRFSVRIMAGTRNVMTGRFLYFPQYVQ